MFCFICAKGIHTDSDGLMLPPFGKDGRSLIQVAIRNDPLSTTGFLPDLVLYEDVELNIELTADDLWSRRRTSNTMIKANTNTNTKPAPAPPATGNKSNVFALFSPADTSGKRTSREEFICGESDSG